MLVAPDKLKGSLTSAQAAVAIAEGVRRVWPAATVRLLAIADGGDGLIDTLVAAGRAEPVSTGIAFLGAASRTVVVEVAQAGGLGGRRPDREEARTASSAAAGALVRAALDFGPECLIVGIGGTASTDGGAGALIALGASVLDSEGQRIGPGLAGLGQAAAVDFTGLDGRLARVSVQVAADVDSPLLGPAGAVRMFGPQKGLAEDDLADGEEAMARFAELLRRAAGVEVAALPGAGAGGGLAAGLAAAAHTAPRSGSGVVFELLGVEEALRESDLVITAEGSLDGQSLMGKAPIVLARRAAALGVPCLAVAGSVTLSASHLRAEGVVAAAALLDREPDLALAIAQAASLLTRTTAELLVRWPYPG